jgi:DNA-binding PadR family transcriptional regulator
MFRYLVLGLLRDGKSRHGYALMKEYRDRAGLQLSTGNFYRELQRLVAEGLVRTVDKPSDGDPRRAPYEITPAGSAAFDAWLTGPTGSGLGRYEDELSSRALFLAAADPGVAQRLIESWKEELWIRSKMHERSRVALITRRPNGVRQPFDVLPFLLARNLKHLAADLEFLEEFRIAYGAWAAKERVPSQQATRAVGSSSQRKFVRGKDPDTRR